MSLLREIQDAATSGATPLADVLRKCKILAARLQNKAFARWVDLELNGYPENEPLPSYRVIDPVQSKGHFVSLTHQGTFPIPLGVIPTPELRERFGTSKSRSSVAYHEALLARTQDDDAGIFQAPWPADLVARIQSKIIQGSVCTSAWQVIPRGTVVQLLDSVRNRILDFAIEIESEAPDAGEAALGGPPPVSVERVNQIINANIFGGTAYLAAGAGITQSPQTLVVQNDLESLRVYLRNQLKVDSSDIGALEAAIREDPAPTPEKGLGPRALAWLAEMTKKGASGAWSIGKEVSTDVLAAALKSYMGLPP
jgi:AbiTii